MLAFDKQRLADTANYFFLMASENDVDDLALLLMLQRYRYFFICYNIQDDNPK